MTLARDHRLRSSAILLAAACVRGLQPARRYFPMPRKHVPSSSSHHPGQLLSTPFDPSSHLSVAKLVGCNIAGKHIRTAPSSSLGISNSGDESAIWHMHRDDCDEWLDEVFIDRSSVYAAHPDESKSSIFTTASLLVEKFIAGNTDGELESNGGRPLLRRIHCGDKQDKSMDEESQSSERMFAPLFGARSSDGPPNSSAPSNTIKPSLKRTPKKGRSRTDLKITVAYRGLEFCGWEDQRHELYREGRGDEDSHKKGSGTDTDGPAAASGGEQPLPSVQGTLADILDPIIGNKANEISNNLRAADDSIPSGEQKRESKSRRKQKTNTKPIEIKVAGRTDRGVSAIGQVCRVRTWQDIEDVETFVRDSVNEGTANVGLGLRATKVERVGGDFHPSFGASSRSYAYLIDLEDEEDWDGGSAAGSSSRPRIYRDLVPKLDRMLRALEGKELDYLALSHGKIKTQTTLCTLHRARAGTVEWSDDDDGTAARAICFELVGNRFLRRMVRLLVATALREAHRDEFDANALVEILATKDRRLRSRAAPPDGLVFVGAEFH